MIPRLELKTIEARKYVKPFERPPKGQLRVDHNSTVTQMELAREGEALVEFAYTTSYGAVGVIKIEGALMYKAADAGALVDQWKSTSKMPNEKASMIHSTVMQACVPEAVGLAKTLRMPPPIPLPQVQFGKGPAGDAKAAGPEAGHGPEFA